MLTVRSLCALEGAAVPDDQQTFAPMQETGTIVIFERTLFLLIGSVMSCQFRHNQKLVFGVNGTLGTHCYLHGNASASVGHWGVR